MARKKSILDYQSLHGVLRWTVRKLNEESGVNYTMFSRAVNNTKPLGPKSLAALDETFQGRAEIKGAEIDPTRPQHYTIIVRNVEE